MNDSRSGPFGPADGAWSREQLMDAEQAGERLKFLFFWGHKPPPSGAIGPHVFSQWYPHGFEVDGCHYSTAEHFMMAEKARLFGDDEHREAILAARAPGEAKKLGRRVRNFDPATWDANPVDIVTRGSAAKFASDDALRHYLVDSGHRVLVEASPRDRIWGIGLGQHNPAASRPSQWRGSNLLGLALMRARAQLRSQE